MQRDGATILAATSICCLKIYMTLLRWRVFLGWVGVGAQLQCICYLVQNTDLGSRDGVSAFNVALFKFHARSVPHFKIGTPLFYE